MFNSILFIGMFWRVLSIRMWILGFFLIAGLGAVFYLVLIQGVESIATRQFLNQEQIIARAEASNVISFFQVFGDSIVVLTQLSSMERRDAKTVQDLDVFTEQWRGSDLVGGVVLTDRNGLVQLNSNVLRIPDVGASLADQDYFLRAKNNSYGGKYFVGQPVTSRLGGTKGQVIVPVAAPVYQKGVFAGVAAASVKLQPLTERYLKLMKVSDLTEVYLIDRDGKILYSPVPDEVGLNVSELLGDNIKNVFGTTQEGKLRRATYLDPKSGKPQNRLIAYSTIFLGDQTWQLIISSASQNVADLTVPIQIRQTAILILVSLTILLFGIIVAKENKT